MHLPGQVKEAQEPVRADLAAGYTRLRPADAYAPGRDAGQLLPHITKKGIRKGAFLLRIFDKCCNMRTGYVKGGIKMRLYGMYYICKKYINKVEEMKFDVSTRNGNTIRSIRDWLEKSLVLNELATVKPLREDARELYEVFPVMYRDKNFFEVTQATAEKFMEKRKLLLAEMRTIILMYETINPNKTQGDICGFDIKMPPINELSEFSQCIEDLNFVITQCPYLNKADGNIKFGSVDVGSTWLTFMIVGAAGMTILTNFGKIIDQAVKIKSHMATVKIQEEALRSMEIKNEIASEVADAFRKVNKAMTQECVKELENDLGKLSDGEEKDKVGRSVEKLALWMEKGMQIYSTIDASPEAKNIFPEQQEMNFLSDDILKLIEMKNNSEK